MTQEELKAIIDYLTAAQAEGRIVEFQDSVECSSKPDHLGIPVPDENKPIYTIIKLKIRNSP